ncbi:MAG TPA: hypothetical protein VFX22_06400 [Candidatus Kapabacteria bacterium]|nr:hypothetical protein [Candidatus Kapabacteria bacterium]
MTQKICFTLSFMGLMSRHQKNSGELIDENSSYYAVSGDVWGRAKIMDMSEDQFTKLFKYIEAFRADVIKRFDENSGEHADIRGAISELSVQVRDYHHENDRLIAPC